MEKGQEKFLEDFPYSEWKKSPDNMDYIYYTIFRGLATRYFSTGQNEKFLSLFKEIDFKTANEIYRWNLTRGHLLGIGDQKLLYRFSSTIIPYLVERQKDQSYLKDFDNDTLKAQQNADSEMDRRLFSHIFLPRGKVTIRMQMRVLNSYQKMEPMKMPV
ncbi:hypothetical protein [Pedobacter sp. P26]|uniref:hypothetical protein n=1 Tax=Pedobacter sp. P26 TaxID=3423956 RepID=UPI003D67FE54